MSTMGVTAVIISVVFGAFLLAYIIAYWIDNPKGRRAAACHEMERLRAEDPSQRCEHGKRKAEVCEGCDPEFFPSKRDVEVKLTAKVEDVERELDRARAAAAVFGVETRAPWKPCTLGPDCRICRARAKQKLFPQTQDERELIITIRGVPKSGKSAIAQVIQHSLRVRGVKVDVVGEDTNSAELSHKFDRAKEILANKQVLIQFEQCQRS